MLISRAQSTLLRVATAGSVDDGKSTLLGRLLHDAQGVFTDQLASVADASERRGTELDLSLLTDGLRAEREQGITIDVAYRYFATAQRSFILADTPGHVQYTRNMVTGASTADVAVVLVDVRHGVSEQSRRHASISALLRVPQIVLVVNKMDLVDWDQGRFDAVVDEFSAYARAVGFDDVPAIPVSALWGDNVVHRSDRADWYDGPSLLEQLEGAESVDGDLEVGFRFPVQYVIRDARADYRGYAGRVAAGGVCLGDDVLVLPSGRRTTVSGIDAYDGELGRADVGQSVVLRLADDLDVSRGDLLVGPVASPTVTRELEGTVCWLGDEPLRAGRYLLKHTTSTTTALLDAVTAVLDVSTGQLGPGSRLSLNDIGRVRLRTARPVAVDDFVRSRRTGAFLLIDEASGATVAAGMVGPLPWRAP